MTVPQRSLGATGIRVSAIGLGTVKLGRNAGLSVAPFELPTLRQARHLLQRAGALGINLLDTAPAYGESEARLGTLLHGVRERWVLCTKAGETFDGQRSRHDFNPAAIQASVEQSLRRLRTDYLDIVLIHSDGRDVEILSRSGALDALDALKRAGKIRATGFSHKTEAGGRLALASCDVLMSAVSRADSSQLGVVREARRARPWGARQEGPRQRHGAPRQPALCRDPSRRDERDGGNTRSRAPRGRHRRGRVQARTPDTSPGECRKRMTSQDGRPASARRTRGLAGRRRCPASARDRAQEGLAHYQRMRGQLPEREAPPISPT